MMPVSSGQIRVNVYLSESPENSLAVLEVALAATGQHPLWSVRGGGQSAKNDLRAEFPWLVSSVS